MRLEVLRPPCRKADLGVQGAVVLAVVDSPEEDSAAGVASAVADFPGAAQVAEAAAVGKSPAGLFDKPGQAIKF